MSYRCVDDRCNIQAYEHIATPAAAVRRQCIITVPSNNALVLTCCFCLAVLFGNCADTAWVVTATSGRGREL